MRARDLAPSKTVYVAENTSIAHCSSGCRNANTRLSPVRAGCLRPDLRVCGTCGVRRSATTAELLEGSAPEDFGLPSVGDRRF